MKAKDYNGIKKVGLPRNFKNYIGFDKLSTEIHEQEGFFDLVQPEFDNETQRLGEIIWNEANRQFTYIVIDKTDEELAAEIEDRLNALDGDFDVAAIKRLLQRVAAPILADEANLTEQDIADAAMLYPYYRVGKAYAAGERFRYEEQLFEVIQAHTSQTNWIPTEVPALYKKFTPAGQISEWVQPLGDQDSYSIGDKVTHNGSTWESSVDNNVWEPGVYG